MIKPLPLIYIAGRFRGATPYDVRKNVEAARDVGLAVAHAGGYPIIPHTMTADFDKLLTDQFWLDGTMELLCRCDAIIMVPGWPTSVGATAELTEAKALNLPVFYSGEYDQLECWVQIWQANAARRQGVSWRQTRHFIAEAVAARGEAPDPRMTLDPAASPRSSAPAPASSASSPPPSPGSP